MAYTTQQLVDLYTNANLGKGPDQALTLTLDAIASQTQVGGLSDDAARAATLKWVNGTTAVAVETYQFFTGKAPSAAGLAYLVNSTTNTADLNDAYYAKFSAENRFINFSINLGVFGDGAATFAAAYGGSSVTYAQVVASAYDKIIGNAVATAAGVDVAAAVAFFSRQANIDYLTAFVKANGITDPAKVDLAIKAALIGEILNAATVAGLGAYSTATKALILDLSDGTLTNPASESIFVTYPSGPAVGEVKDLSINIDTITGTSAADTYTGVFGGTAPTLNALDSIKGGAGLDTLNINAVAALTNTSLTGVTIAEIETVNVRGALTVYADSTNWGGVTALNITQSSGGAQALAGSATAITVSGNTGGGNIVVDGGSTVTVTDAGATPNGIVVGQTVSATGAVSITDTNTTTGGVYVDGGTTVTVTQSGVTTGGSVQIGQGGADSDFATGAITVTTTGLAYAATDSNLAHANNSIRGGSSVTYTSVATSSTAAVATDTSATTITQGNVGITGTAATTSVSVTQTAAVTARNATIAVAPVAEVQKVTFVALTAGQSVTVNGLTFKAAVDLTAAQVAAAFAGLTSDIYSPTGNAPISQGTYTGSWGGNFEGETGSVTTDGTSAYVSFTTYENGNIADVGTAGAGGASAPVVSTTVAGVGVTSAVAGRVGIVAGQVTINGAITGADVLTTVSVDGYGNNSSIASDALTSLSLGHSGSALMTLTNTAATTLGLKLDTVGSSTAPAALVDTNGVYTTLNVTTANGDSNLNAVFNGVKTLTVDGTKAVTFNTSSSFSALEAVAVKGTAGLSLSTAAGTITSVDTTATTGKVSVTIDGTKATYTGGAGVDVVTLSTTAPTKAISLGAGDDTLILASGTTSSTGVLSGGDGTDTISMTSVDVAAATVGTTFGTQIDGFEKLAIRQIAGNTSVVDLSHLDNINYVTLSGGLGGTTTASVVYTQGVAATTTEKADITFGTSTAGSTYTIEGRTITVVGASATGAEIAAAFNTGTSSANVSVTGAIGGAWSTSVATNVLTVTSTTPNAVVTDLNYSDSSVDSALTLNKFIGGGTVEFTSNGPGVTVNVVDAATNTADVLNLKLTTSTSNIDVGTVTAAKVETINVNSFDSDVTLSTGSGVQSRDLYIADAELKAINVTGNAHLDLGHNSAVQIKIDASAFTGDLYAYTNSVAGSSIIGGSGNDYLYVYANQGSATGGAGVDYLYAGADLVTLTGGAGADYFDASHTVSTSNSYATITDFSTGDVLYLSGNTFASAKVVLANTAVFQDYANASIVNSTAGSVVWFQYAGDTYVVTNHSGNGASFQNTTDTIVKLTGALDLSTASFNTGYGELTL